MNIKSEAVAGTLESSDAQVTVRPSDKGLFVHIESSVMNQYGRQIKATVVETLKNLGVRFGSVEVVDKGALDCTIKARVECAVLRSNEAAEKNIDWNFEKTAKVTRGKPEKVRLRRTMMFMNAQKPGLIKDAYIYGSDSIILDLEDAVAENQKDAARFSLYHALKNIDYGKTEVIVRINGLDTPHWQEDIRCVVAGGADGIRIAKCESAEDVRKVEAEVIKAEKEFGVEEGRTLLMAALESPKGIMNAYEILMASPRMFGCAISGGDFRKSMHVQIERDGIEMMTARGNMLMAARAAGLQCFDTMWPNIDDVEGFQSEVRQNRKMGFDGKSVVNPKQIQYVHDTFAPTPKEIAYAEKLCRSFNEQADAGVGVYTVDGKMVDIPFFEDARRVIELAKACGVYHGDL